MPSKPTKYRIEVSTDHQKELRMAAALAGLSVPEYVEVVLRPKVRADLQGRMIAQGLTANK